MPDLVDVFPHLNASLNALAGVLLLVGFFLIKSKGGDRAKREQQHKVVMLSAFATSVVFLVCYLTYHFALKEEGHTKFDPSYGDAIRYTYYLVLLTHVVLAAAVPFLAVWTIYLGYRDQRAAHRKWAKITFPIWLYVSATGVLVYLMLYHWFPVKLH
jgi:putative membrane protein